MCEPWNRTRNLWVLSIWPFSCVGIKLRIPLIWRLEIPFGHLEGCLPGMGSLKSPLRSALPDLNNGGVLWGHLCSQLLSGVPLHHQLWRSIGFLLPSRGYDLEPDIVCCLSSVSDFERDLQAYMKTGIKRVKGDALGAPIEDTEEFLLWRNMLSGLPYVELPDAPPVGLMDNGERWPGDDGDSCRCGMIRGSVDPDEWIICVGAWTKIFSRRCNSLSTRFSIRVHTSSSFCNALLGSSIIARESLFSLLAHKFWK